MPKDVQPEKRKPRRIPSDDCVVEGAHPHRGEWVEIVGAPSVRELRASWSATSLAVQIEGLRDDEQIARDAINAIGEDGDKSELARQRQALTDAIEARIELVDGSFDELSAAVARRVVAWTWTNDMGQPIVPWNATDADGRPYAKLDGSQATIELLEVEELTYLRGLLTGEAPAERLNGKSDSAAISSDGMSAATSSQTNHRVPVHSRTKR